MLINFNHIKTLYSALVQKMKGFRGNWEQNDPNADDYIKNRTHWSEGIKETTIADWKVDFDNGTIVSTMDTTGPTVYQAMIEDTSLIAFKIGQKYTVIWDKKTYECIAQEIDGVGTIGNISLGFMDSTGYEDTGEPFLIGIDGNLGIVFSTKTGSHTCTIKTITEIVHKLDKKFIDMPDGIVTEDRLPTILEDTLAPVSFTNKYDSLSGKPTIYTDVVRYGTSQSLSDSQKSVARTNIGASDFSGSYNDLTESPCYDLTTYELHASSTSSGWTDWTHSNSSTTTAAFYNTTIPRIELGKTYRINIYNSSGIQVYSTECIAKTGIDINKTERTMIGNSTIWYGIGENTGEPILIYWHDGTSKAATVFVDFGVVSSAKRVDIHKSIDVLKQLDEKFIPNTIVRKSEVYLKEETYSDTTATRTITWYEDTTGRDSFKTSPGSTTTYYKISDSIFKIEDLISLSDYKMVGGTYDGVTGLKEGIYWYNGIAIVDAPGIYNNPGNPTDTFKVPSAGIYFVRIKKGIYVKSATFTYKARTLLPDVVGITRTVNGIAPDADGNVEIDSYTKTESDEKYALKTDAVNKAYVDNEISSKTPKIAQETGESTSLVMSQKAVTRAIEAFTALPYGGSKEWLEINGDKAKLYQIGGYVWGYVDSDGWTKSDVQFRVVRGTFEMTDTGGIPYLSCPTGATLGAVYKYTEASGDIGVPVYDSKPTTANEGDIIAVGERKYKASLTSKQVPAFTNLAVTLHENKRYNSSGTLVDESGACSCEEYIPFGSGTVVRIRGLGDLNTYNCMGYDNASTTVRASFKPAMKSVSGDYLTYSYDSATDTATLTSEGHSYVQRMRVSGVLNGSVDDVIITVNEKISYNTETTVTWTDIGSYTPPTEAGWSATDEVYNIIDSLSATASSGASAVYRADGFLYTFVEGSDWVQTSRYDAPTIAIDGDLSDSSTNAVQNKIVTAQFNDIHSKVNAHTNELSAIKDQLGNVATVPSFWKDAVDVCVSKIKALQVNRNCVTFPFFSDNHTRDGKTQYMGILIAHVMKECGIPYCFCGGDAITSAMASTADSDAEFKAMAKAFDTAMSYIPDGRFFMALGNHETWLVANPNIEGSTRVDYGRNEQYNIFLRNKLSGQNAHVGGDGTYYYVDDIASKVRWIVLNTNGINNNNIDSEQLTWFENTALKFNESGWGVVIISHIPITNHYEQSNIGNNTAVIAKVKAYMNGSDANKASIIGWYSGHIHRDRIYSGVSVNDTDDSVGEDMGFKQVTITSDHTGIAYPIGKSPAYHAIANDDKSHAIDFVTINKETRTVNITRLGIGEDRSYTY